MLKPLPKNFYSNFMHVFYLIWLSFSYRNPLCKSCTPTGSCADYVSLYDHPVKYAVDTYTSGDATYCETDADLVVNVLAHVDVIHSHCLNSLLPFVCRWVYYPTCDPATSVPTQQIVCRRACEILTVFLCPEAWNLYLQQSSILTVPRGNNLFTCNNLMYSNGGDVPDCIDPLDGGEYPLYFYLYFLCK